MRLLFTALLLLLATPHVYRGNAYGAQAKSQQSPKDTESNLQQSGRISNSEISEIQKQDKTENPYNARQDCLYRAYLAFTILGVLGGVAGVIAIFWQTRLLRQTVQSSTEQSEAMERHIAEAARSANAMEGVAKSLETTAKASADSVKGLRQQMRAYVTTTIGGAVYQDRPNNIRFMASPGFVNNGLTPAHKVRHKSKADILPVPIPQDFTYPLPGAYSGETIMGPRQQSTINVAVDTYIADADVEDVKGSQGRGLYVWGLIEYEDVFGATQHTRFCQLMTWLPNGTVWGTYIPGHNDGT